MVREESDENKSHTHTRLTYAASYFPYDTVVGEMAVESFRTISFLLSWIELEYKEIGLDQLFPNFST